MVEILRRYLGPYRGRFVLAVVTKFVEVVFNILTPIVVARMIDSGVANRDLDEVTRLGIVLVAFTLVGYGFTLICQKLASVVSQGVGTDLRHALFDKVMHLAPADVDRFGTPSLVTRVTSDVNQIQLAVALAARMLIRWPLIALGSMVAACMINLNLGLLLVLCTLVVGGIFWLVMARSVPFFRQMQGKLDHVSLIAREGLSGVRVIRAFRRDEYEQRRFEGAAKAQTDVAVAAGVLSATLNPATFLVMNLGIVWILWESERWVFAGIVSQGEVVAFVNYMMQTLESIAYLANLVVTFTRGSACAQRVLEVLDTPETLTEKVWAKAPEATFATPVLELERASFAYGDGNGDGVNLGESSSGVIPSTRGVEQSPSYEAMTPEEPVLVTNNHREDRSDTVSSKEGLCSTPLVEETVSERASQVKSSESPGLALKDSGALAERYLDERADAVHEVTLTLMQGGTLGIIGGTGSGKSTLAALVCRLYDVTGGSVKVLGTDVRDWPIDELRRTVSIVPQQATLVSGTVRSNLSWREADGLVASDEELWRALDLAQAGFVRELPEGLDAPVEAGGRNFSGGQRQRLTIARALVGSPKLVVLDDSASALDFATDAHLRQALRSLSPQTASIVISQRISAVMGADLICVLDHGEVAGLGGHRELMRSCPLYREICLTQLRAEEVE